MANLELTGPLDLTGTIALAGDGGGKVLVNGAEALVEDASGTAPIVLVPPPPASPADSSTNVKCVRSLGAGITAGGKTLVTTGLVLQGIWPGMITPSTKNASPQLVTANGVPVNVRQDSAVIFPNGGSVTITDSGQP
jgi:hypothetical protein